MLSPCRIAYHSAKESRQRRSMLQSNGCLPPVCGLISIKKTSSHLNHLNNTALDTTSASILAFLSPCTVPFTKPGCLSCLSISREKHKSRSTRSQHMHGDISSSTYLMVLLKSLIPRDIPSGRRNLSSVFSPSSLYLVESISNSSKVRWLD